MIEIKCHVRVDGGRLLTAANAHRIKCVSLVPSDRMGNRLEKHAGKDVSPIYELRNEPPYFQEWRIFRSLKGYAFREIKHGGGICGYKCTVRELVISASVFGIFGPCGERVVQVEDERPGFGPSYWQTRFKAMDEADQIKWARTEASARRAA
jgi:hypothetical protein